MSLLRRNAREYRIFFSRGLAVFLLLVVLFTHHSWEDAPWERGFEILAYTLVVVAAMGRLWSGMYISGRKEKELVTEGPYSMVRNPLYFFSLLGAIGIAIVTENLLVILLVFLAFGFYYPFVVKGEEDGLRKAFGRDFDAYCKSTPRFWPKFSLFKEPATVTVNTSSFRRAFLDAMWFYWIFLILLIIEGFHESGILPALWQIP